MTHTTADDPRVQWLTETAVPLVSHGQTNFHHDWVDFDNAQFAYDGQRWLQSLGCRTIGMIGPDPALNYARELVRQVDPITQLSAVKLNDPPHAIYQYVKQTARQIDGWILPDESLVVPVSAALRDTGLTPGIDRHLVVKRFGQQFEYLGVKAHWCDERLEFAGHTMADMMLQRLNHPDMPKQTHLIAPLFELRGASYGI